jgi:hypothetical protein
VHDTDHKVDGTAVVNKADVRSDCALFKNFGTDEYGCIKCAWGKVGNKLTYAEPFAGTHTLGACETMSSC